MSATKRSSFEALAKQSSMSDCPKMSASEVTARGKFSFFTSLSLMLLLTWLKHLSWTASGKLSIIALERLHGLTICAEGF